MPVNPTYPGVYIEEIPSGVRTIVGVATSITAFIGRAARGPTNEPVTINSYADYERRFGSLSRNYPMGFAVRDFYLNRGKQAIIVRATSTSSKASKAKLSLTAGAGKLELEAASEGKWGSNLGAEVDYDGITEAMEERYKPLKKSELFNLTLRDLDRGDTERFLGVTVVANNPRSVDLVLKNSSNLARVSGSLPSTRPDETDAVVKAALEALKTAGEAEGATEEDQKKGKDAADKLKLLEKAFSPGQTWRYTTVATVDEGADSGALTANDIVSGSGLQDNKQGLYALDKADLFNLLCIPPDTVDGTVDSTIWQAAMKYCAERRAMLIVDPPKAWADNVDTAASTAKDGLDALGLTGTEARNAAIYFPRVTEADPTMDGQPDTFAPCGIIAGVMARTDAQRGVWKAPAGLDATIAGVQGLQANLNDAENGMLNPLGINCLRAFPVYGRVVWGARTLRGADQLADEYKYVPIRRLALYIEESLYRGLKWVVFEPNDEPLWAQIRLNVGTFMHNLFRQGAFQGSTPREAYFVKCDAETTPQADRDLGIVNIIVGFAPLKPAEFVIIKLQQMAGQTEA